MQSRKSKKYIIADLGASNGRILLGSFEGQKIKLESLWRFENYPVLVSGISYWDFLYLYENIKRGLNLAMGMSKKIVSISIDTWGLDFCLTDKDNQVLSNPVTYRDPSKSSYDLDAFFKNMSREEYFHKTGWIEYSIGPPFYLHDLKIKRAIDFDQIHKFLMMPDLFNYLLTCEYTNEFSISSNSLMLDCTKKIFDADMIKAAGLKKENFSRIVDPSQKIGKIKPDPSLEDNAKDMDVVACSSHDTASAVCGIPAVNGSDWAFVSLGTWCVFGTETDNPILDMDILNYGITNEGISRKSSFLAKNATGLWVMQQCMHKWRKDIDHTLSYADIDELYPAATRFLGFIDLDDPAFASMQPDMPFLIYESCRKKGYNIGKDIAGISRCVYESIIMLIKYYIKLLEGFSKKEFRQTYLFGGGAKNKLFCQWLADALVMPVNVSNPESASTGNLLMQLISDGEAKDIGQAREIARSSFEMQMYEPKDISSWKRGYEKYLKTTKGD